MGLQHGTRPTQVCTPVVYQTPHALLGGFTHTNWCTSSPWGSWTKGTPSPVFDAGLRPPHIGLGRHGPLLLHVLIGQHLHQDVPRRWRGSFCLSSPGMSRLCCEAVFFSFPRKSRPLLQIWATLWHFARSRCPSGALFGKAVGSQWGK